MRTWHDTDCTWTRGNPVSGEPARPCSCGYNKELEDMIDLAGLVPTFEFHLSAEEYDEFEAMLDSPPRVSPKLAELLSQPSVFDDEDADA